MYCRNIVPLAGKPVFFGTFSFGSHDAIIVWQALGNTL
jgi:hypothetical protein